MKRTSFVMACGWFALAAIFTLPNAAPAATITWAGAGTGITMNADSDIVTNGVGLYAYDMANINATVNGVNFTGLASPGLNTTTNVGITSSSSGTVVYNATVFAPIGGTGSPFYTTLSSAYQSILAGGNYNSAPQAYCTLTLNNLTVGRTYAVQFWVVDTRAATSSRAEIVTYPIVTPSIAYNTIKAVNGLGQYAIGVFTADSAVQTIVLNPTSTTTGAAQVNALQLRDITGAGYNLPAFWNGGSTADSNWSDSTNWTGVNITDNSTLSKMTFNGSKLLTNTNDLNGLTINGLSLNTANWNITGNPITLGGNVTGSSTGTSTWALDTVLAVTPIFSQTAAGGILNLAGVYSGTNGISVSSGSGAVNFTGLNNSFTGPVTVSGGTLGYSSLANAGQNSSLGAGNGTINVGSAGNTAALSFIGSNNIATARGLAFTNNSSGAITLNNNSANNSSQTFNGAVSLYDATANDIATYNLGGTSTGTNTFNGSWGNVNNTIVRFPGNLNISGPGTWVFNGLMALTNNLNIGTNSDFVLGSGTGNSSLMASAITVQPGGVFDVSAYSSSTPFVLGAYAFASPPAPQTMTAGRPDGTSVGDIVGNFALGTATLNVASNGVPGTLTINGNFIPATNAGASVINFDLASTTTAGAAVNDLIQVNGNLDLSQGTASILVNALQGSIQTGVPYTLISYTGSLTGNASGISVRSSLRTYVGVVSTATPGMVTVTFSASGLPPNRLLWQGGVNQNWDLAATANWLNNGNSDYFYSQDNPFFDDTASQFNVNLVGNLTPGTVTVTNNVNNYTFAGNGALTGAANLVKQGTGTLTLAVANSYTGGTLISAGTLNLAVNNAAGAGPITDNGVLAFTGTGISLSNAVAGTGNLNLAANSTVTAAVSGQLTNLTGSINLGSGSTLTLAGLNNFASAVNLQNNSSFTLSGTNTFCGPVNLQGATSFSTAASGSTIISNLSSTVGNAYSLTTRGAGTIALAGSNTYTGPTIVLNGIVNVLGNESAATGGWILTNNAVAETINFQPSSTVVVAGTNLVQAGSWPIAASGSSVQTVNSYGFVTNNGTLVVGRSGILNVSGNVWVQNGPLTNNPPGNSGYSASMSVNPGGTFIYNGNSPIMLAPSTGNSGHGILSISGGTFKTSQGFVNLVTTSVGSADIIIATNGTLAFTANLSGLMTSTAGATNTFKIGNGGGTLDNGGFNVTLADNIADVTGQHGAVTFAGNGITTLNGTNTYTGTTTVNAGTLVVNGILTTNVAMVQTGAILGGTGFVNGTLVVNGSIAPGTGNSVGTLTVSNATLNGGGKYLFNVSNTVDGAGQDLLKVAAHSMWRPPPAVRLPSNSLP